MANRTSDNNQNINNTGTPAHTVSVDNAEVNADQMKGSPLHQLFLTALKNIYFAENAILEALDEMQRMATTKELKDAFEDHRLQTQKQVSRLEKVFGLIDETPEKKECKGIKGIIEEGQEIAGSTKEGSITRDAVLIIAAQKVEHYEIATYGGLAQLATTMGHDKAADLLEKTLQEEEDTDYNLTEIAETFINFNAEQEN